MAITQTICNSWKQELAQALHDFTTGTGHIFKVALYTSAANLDANTTIYNTLNEVVGIGYTPGGFSFNPSQNITPQINGTTTFWSWSVNPTWLSSTITARGALIYNATSGNRAVAVLDFLNDKITTNGTFTIQLPVNAVSSALLKLL